jgi:hypothetical protein
MMICLKVIHNPLSCDPCLATKIPLQKSVIAGHNARYATKDNCYRADSS